MLRAMKKATAQLNPGNSYSIIDMNGVYGVYGVYERRRGELEGTKGVNRNEIIR